MPAIPRIPGTVDITLFCSGGDTQIRTGDEGFADLHVHPSFPHYSPVLVRFSRCIGTHTVTCIMLFLPYVSYSIGLRHGLQLLSVIFLIFSPLAQRVVFSSFNSAVILDFPRFSRCCC